MGFFSQLYGLYERRALEATYISLSMRQSLADAGLLGRPIVGSPSEARRTVRKWLAEASAEGQAEGTANLSRQLGREMLHQALTDPLVAQRLEALRNDGVRDGDIEWWWGLADLERRVIHKMHNAQKMAAFRVALEEGNEPEKAALTVRRLFPLYLDPTDTTSTTGDDRPLPAELQKRIFIWLYAQQARHPEFKTRLREASTLNALIREDIRRGLL